jgi:hypothetical protein
VATDCHPQHSRAAKKVKAVVATFVGGECRCSFVSDRTAHPELRLMEWGVALDSK